MVLCEEERLAKKFGDESGEREEQESRRGSEEGKRRAWIAKREGGKLLRMGRVEDGDDMELQG